MSQPKLMSVEEARVNTSVPFEQRGSYGIDKDTYCACLTIHALTEALKRECDKTETHEVPTDFCDCDSHKLLREIGALK